MHRVVRLVNFIFISNGDCSLAWGLRGTSLQQYLRPGSPPCMKYRLMSKSAEDKAPPPKGGMPTYRVRVGNVNSVAGNSHFGSWGPVGGFGSFPSRPSVTLTL